LAPREVDGMPMESHARARGFPSRHAAGIPAASAELHFFAAGMPSALPVAICPDRRRHADGITPPVPVVQMPARDSLGLGKP
jgi:hypothetical protein